MHGIFDEKRVILWRTIYDLNVKGLVLGISGSFREGGNTDYLLLKALEIFKERKFNVKLVALRNYKIGYTKSCRRCLEEGKCIIDDDMTRRIAPLLLRARIIILASPVYFDNVTALMKTFMDRTWWLRGKLRYKIGEGIVVGRGYGLDTALQEIHNFMLKHEMIICHRGVRCRAFEKNEAAKDETALKDIEKWLIH